jgi:hypothetical protein
VTLWGRTAEIAARYCKKGKPLMVEGRLQLEYWKIGRPARTLATTVDRHRQSQFEGVVTPFSVTTTKVISQRLTPSVKCLNRRTYCLDIG